MYEMMQYLIIHDEIYENIKSIMMNDDVDFCPLKKRFAQTIQKRKKPKNPINTKLFYTHF